MDYDFFNRLKELYHPVFSKDTTEAQIASAKLAFIQINFKAPLRNRIIDYISMYGDFRFSHNPTDLNFKGKSLWNEWEYLKNKYGYIDLIPVGDFWHGIR